MERFVRQMIMILVSSIGLILDGNVWGQVFDSNIPNGYAKITLIAGDVWGDNTGYQMLIDANANTYGSTIPETGGLTSSGDASASTYAEFEYKIPTNADGSLNTSNIVFEDEISILIPIGTYDWCITNPTPGDRMWIASSGGNTNARQDDFIFENQYHYIFTITLGNDGHDRTDLNLPPKPREQCQVGDNWGESSMPYLPAYSYYNYSLTQQIYTADEIGSDGEIGTISFYNNNDTRTRNIDIYLKHTDKSVFDNTTDWISVGLGDKVFSGTINFTANVWSIITLDKVFEYNGIDNLVVVIDDNTGSWESNPMECRIYDTYEVDEYLVQVPINQAIRIYSDGTNYNPLNPAQYSGTLLIYKNQIKLCTEEGWTLPITLLSFTVTANPEGNLLEWLTATEEHNAGFKLQRSTDAINWTDFAWVTSACSGNSIENTNYSFLDDNPPSDTTYYRFEQMDSTSYSTTYYSDIVVAMREPATNNIIPSVYYDNCICLVGGDKVCDAYVYYPDGRMRYSARLNPYETKRLNIYGFYIIEVLWVEDGDLQRKTFKVFSY